MDGPADPPPPLADGPALLGAALLALGCPPIPREGVPLAACHAAGLRRALVVGLLGLRYSRRRVASLMGVSPATVERIVRRGPGPEARRGTTL